MNTPAPIPWESFDEEELLAQARQGSKEAIQEMIGRHEPWLRRVLQRWLAARLSSVVGVDDLMQEVRLSFFKTAIRAEALASLAAFLSYLFKSAVNKAWEIYRHWHRRKRSLARENGALAGALADGHRRHWEQDEELIEAVVALYRQMPKPMDSVYVMRLQKGTVQQIAKILGMSERSVYRALVIAEKRVRTMLLEGAVSPTR